MKIYLPDGTTRNHRVYAQPGKFSKENSDWFERGLDGKPDYERPILFPVEFKAGAADVPSHLGRFMVDQGVAQDTFLALPKVSVDPIGDERARVRPKQRVYA